MKVGMNDFDHNFHKWIDAQDRRRKTDPLRLAQHNNSELFFEEKLHEMIQQYTFARTYLGQIDCSNWDYWFSTSGSDINDSTIKAMLNGSFLEIAILYYNIAVDLSWTLAYTSMEFAHYKNGRRSQSSAESPTHETVQIIRDFEKYISEPTNPSNPLLYLQRQGEEYANVVSHLITFWDKFKDSEIRNLNNFLKHRGKPYYIQEQSTKLFSLRINDVEYATDFVDLQKEVDIYTVQSQLIDFDNSDLYPYCDELIDMLLPIIVA